MKSNDLLNKKRGLRLKDCREASGLTQEALSMKAGYSIQTISYIENGKRGMTIESARIFGKYLEVRMEYLLCEDNYKTVRDLYSEVILSNKKEDYISDAFTENGYLPLEVLGNKIAEYQDPLSHEEIELINVDRYIIRTANNKYITCSEEKYKDMIEEINDFIILKLKRLENSCEPASDDDIRYFLSEFEMSDDELN